MLLFEIEVKVEASDGPFVKPCKLGFQDSGLEVVVVVLVDGVLFGRLRSESLPAEGQCCGLPEWKKCWIPTV